MLEGIDIYEGIGAVEWHKVAAAGKSFAFIRGAYGSRADKMAKQNFAAAKSEGLVCGLYHFFRQPLPTQDQIDCFSGVLDSCGVGTGDLPPVLDIEDNPNYDGPWNTANNAAYIEALSTWAQTFTARFNVSPVVYMRTSFWQTLGNPDGFNDCPLWLARYSSIPTPLPAGWGAYQFWQYSETGDVNGVSGHCDLNRSSAVDSAALALLTIR